MSRIGQHEPINLEAGKSINLEILFPLPRHSQAKVRVQLSKCESCAESAQVRSTSIDWSLDWTTMIDWTQISLSVFKKNVNA